jgi:hypothetical protein
MKIKIFSRSSVLVLLATILLLIVAAASVIYFYTGWYGFNVILNRGSSVWNSITADNSRLSQPMRLALTPTPPEGIAGSFQWTVQERDFETAELPVFVDGREVDRILLARINPRSFRFDVFNVPAGDRNLDDWMQILNAKLVINGSYYGNDGRPSTPILINGKVHGPTSYPATHGVFVTSNTKTGIIDLQYTTWKEAFQSARSGMVSYPILVNSGPSRVKADDRWLANRTFIGEDTDGRILIGTTREAFFSLRRLADFLRTAPLDLRLALNLDGGPVACQGISIRTFKRHFCGLWETKFQNDQLMLLGNLIGKQRRNLPIVLAVTSK